MKSISIGVFDENEIFRRGAVACLDADPFLEVVADGPRPVSAEIDVAVVSVSVATTYPPSGPLVVCGSGDAITGPLVREDDVFAVLDVRTVTAEQLVSAARAAAVGLHVQAPVRPPVRLDARSIDVLRLLSEGAATREISDRLGYSERTIKEIIREIHSDLGVRNRAHAVATALREHLI